MIPKPVVEFLTGPLFGMAGTADANNVPHVQRVWGWHDSDGSTIRFFVPKTHLQHLESDIAANSRIALNIADGLSHETYQLKGQVTNIEPSNEADVAQYEKQLEALIAYMAPAGYPAEGMRAFTNAPARTVTMNVSEVFLQTPGPDAGKRIAPEGETS